MESPRSQPRPTAPAPRELEPDDPTRVGRYRIEARIGEGGMGAVYLGRDPGGRAVAVKVVRPDLAGDRMFLARFHDEAAHAQRVASFCTAQVLEHGDDLGLAYMVTEYIEGPSLLDHVTATGPLSPGMLHGVAVGVAAALVAIHSAGLVHRDLKPSNVLLSISGPRVIDFGIARALDAASSHTRTGQVVGTPGWFAPEQITAQRITTAVDVFAWGCLVAFAATGRNPFGQGSFELMAARAVHAEPELGPVPEPLAGLVRAALRKDPDQRPSARELLLDLVGGAGEADVSHTLGASWTTPPVPRPDVTSRDPGGAAPRPHSPGGAAPMPQPPAGGAGPVPHPATAPANELAQAAPAPESERRQQIPHARTTPSHEAYASPEIGPPPVTVPHGRRDRRGPVIAAAGAVLVAALVAAGGAYFLTRPDGDHGKSGGSAAPATGFPSGPMLVRIDTRPGWPKDCHADIGTYTPGSAAPKTLVGGPSCDTLPERSPDGTRIAFSRSSGGTNSAWVMNADGSDARKVTDIAGGRVTWSPDGKRLAFMGGAGVGDTTGTHQIYAIALDTRTVTRLTGDDSAKDDPMWSSKGQIVFWSRKDGAEQIYTLDPDHPSRQWTRLTKDGVRAVDPEWSPDASKIAYTHGPSATSDIWLMNADGSNPHPLTTGGAHAMDPGWSRNGRWLCYVSGPVGTPEIHAVRADGTGDRVITPAGQVLGHPSWS
ncbi:Tol-Pal system protein TolB [Actinomadura sp. RB99]|uniref:protein kinase domain-containing protein n=1 Tax=Actinomadura sp. RB99 TaxID=2691577 RepID=UPI001681D2F2|nr:protein kinase [Actinomadura sp. RB99]MBD2895485.1 Tol-Pal system protein TolB [Actinomadura sp. RB99]